MTPRPTYTPERRKRIVRALRAGATQAKAAAFAGVAPTTLRGWLAAGRAYLADPTTGDKRYARLARECDQAAAESDVVLIGFMYAAAEGTPAVRDPRTGEVVKPRIPGDWRAAEGLLKIKLDRAERRVRLRKNRAEAIVSEKRAEGTLPPTQIDVKDERARNDRIAELLRKAGRTVPVDAGGDGGTGVPPGVRGEPPG